MTKKIMLLTCLFLLSGCSANYSLSIDDTGYHESLEITNSNYDNSYQEQIEKALVASMPVDINYYDPVNVHKVNDVIYYNIIKNKSDDELGITYSYDFDYENYQNSTIVKLFDPKSQILQNNSILSLNATLNKDLFLKYPNLDKLNIKITTNKKVYNQNANRISGNSYYWEISKSDDINRKINFSFDRYENKKVDTSSKYTNIIYISIGILFLVGCLILFIKIKNSNK